VRFLFRSLSCLSDFDLPSSAPPPRDPWPLAPFPSLRHPPKPKPPPCPLANHLRSPWLWHPPAHRHLHSGAWLPWHGAATHQVCHAVVLSTTLLMIFLSIHSACVEKIHTFSNV
ncbi:hypothetical protein B296_00036482, partial [Ensete ventricosum]